MFLSNEKELRSEKESGRLNVITLTFDPLPFGCVRSEYQTAVD